MSSDSSDEENIDLLREAVDSQFFNDSMFEKKDDQTVIGYRQPSINKLPASLRKAQDEDEQFNLFRVTPEFRNHVAKHLSKALDEKLQKLFKSVKDIDSIPRKKCRKSGVRLFKNSQKFLKIDKCETAHNNNRLQNAVLAKTRLVSKFFSTSETVDEALLKTIAVPPEDILSKKDTKFWSSRSKAPVYSYKKSSNGSLVLIEPSIK